MKADQWRKAPGERDPDNIRGNQPRERRPMTPSQLDWPICPIRGFMVNPKKQCPKCKKKRFLKFNKERQKWECNQ
jgi:hypothetical protein